MMFTFVWNKNKDKMNRKTSIKNTLLGGIGIPDIKKIIDGTKINMDS